MNNSGTARAVRWELWQTLQRAGQFNPDARASRLTPYGGCIGENACFDYDPHGF